MKISELIQNFSKEDHQPKQRQSSQAQEDKKKSKKKKHLDKASVPELMKQPKNRIVRILPRKLFQAMIEE